MSGCSTIEHHSHVDRKTLVDNSSVLPYSYIGQGLNVVHSVVGFAQIAQVKRNVTVSIADAKLMRVISSSSVKRALEPVRSTLSRVSQGLSARLGRKKMDELAGGSRLAQRKANEAVVQELPHKENAHAAAASASRHAKVKKRATNN